MAGSFCSCAFLASTLTLAPPADDVDSLVRARGATSAAVVYTEHEPEDPTIDKAGRQMMTLLSFTTFGALTGKALFRR